MSKFMLTKLQDSIEESFKINFKNIDFGSDQYFSEISKFILLVIYFQVIENQDCEQLIVNNAYEEYFMEVLKKFSGMDGNIGEVVIDDSAKKRYTLTCPDSLLIPNFAEKFLTQDLEKKISTLQEENSTLKSELEFHKNEVNQYKNQYENIKLQ